MRLPWRHEDRQIRPIRPVSTTARELEAAKDILSEVFQIPPLEAEDMIQQRLEERNCRETELRPATMGDGQV